MLYFTDPAAGGSYDYAKGVAGIKYSYTMELPPTNNGYNSYVGFTLPYDEISTIAADTFNGIKALALYLDRAQPHGSSNANTFAHGGNAGNVASRDVRTSGNVVQPLQQHLMSPNDRSLTSGNDVVYSSYSGLNDYIRALPQHLREWFVQHINRLGSK